MRLTSPHTKGPEVRRLQSLLKDKGYYSHKVDGEYGPSTAQAVYRAKYWLGYAKPDQVAGKKLLAFLDGTRKRNPLMVVRANKRKKDSKQLGVSILVHALHDLGIKENPPNSNRSVISLWFGEIGPWCAMSVTRWCVFAGSKVFKRGRFEAYVPTIVGYARAGKNYLTVVNKPVTGCLPCYDWGDDGTADHIGVYAEELHLRIFAPNELAAAMQAFGALGKGEFWAIEGNTGIGNDSNGGEVMLRKRNTSSVQVFVHVGR